MKNLVKIMSLVGFAVLASACGNQAQTPDPRFLPNSSNLGNMNPNSSMPGYMQCSEVINIRNSGGDLTKEYRACSVAGSMGSVRIHPVTPASEPVCVFPAQNGTPLVYGNQFLAQCGTLSASGSTLNFQGANFDSIYVVSQSRASTLSQCFYYGNPTACAGQSGFTYAYGRF